MEKQLFEKQNLTINVSPKFEKQNLTINVNPTLLFLLMQTIVNNEEGLLENLEETLGLTPEVQEGVKEAIRELYELSEHLIFDFFLDIKFINFLKN